MSLYPYPGLMIAGRSIAISVASVSYQYDGFAPGFVRAPAPVGGQAGGSIAPATLNGANIIAVLVRVLPGPVRQLQFVVAGTRAQNFFTRIRVPGVSGGAWLNTADATFDAPDPHGNSRWIWTVTGDVATGNIQVQ